MAFKGVCFYIVFFALLPSTAARVTKHSTKATTYRHGAMLVSTSALRQTTTKPKTISSTISTPTTTSPRVATTGVVKTPGPRLPTTKTHNAYYSILRQTTTKPRTTPSSTSTSTTTSPRVATTSVPKTPGPRLPETKTHRTHHSNSFELKFLNDSKSVTVENGVESNLDFFLRDFASLNRHIRIIVQYGRSGGNYNKICQIEHSKTSGCNVNAASCKCVGEQSGSFRYRLNMTFTEQYNGVSLYFSLWDKNNNNINNVFVTVNVVAAHVTRHPAKATTHRHVVILESTSTPRPTTIRPTTILSSTTTPTTTSPNVDVATAAATTHSVVDTPDPHLLDTKSNNDNGDTDEFQSEETAESSGDTSGSGFVVMNVIAISFLMLASQWGLM